MSSDQTSDQTFSCVFCNETFTDREILQEHFRKHGERSVGQSAKAESNQKESPGKMTSANEMVKCDVCDDVFPTVSKAITHKHKAHPDHNTKYFCSWCGKLFTMKHLYNKHMLNHQDVQQGEEVFHCDCCDVDFYLLSAMAYHNTSFHRDSELPDVGHSRKQKLVNKDLVSVYYCPFCGEENITRVNMNKHISEEHSGEDQSPDEVMRCPLCDAIFYHLDAYEAHLTYHSPDDIYSGMDNPNKDSITEYTIDSVPPLMETVEEADEATTTLDELLQMADGGDSTERRKHKKKHKKHKKSKKETITLDEFLSMSDVIGGEGLDIHGIEVVPTQALAKTFNPKPRPQVRKDIKTPTSQIEKLKRQGIIIKKTATQRNPPTTIKKSVVNTGNASNRPKLAVPPQAEVENQNQNVISKLLNQNKNQLVISKTTKNKVVEEGKDFSLPDLLNKSHESLQIECDVPLGSSDMEQDDAVSTSTPKDEEEITHGDDDKGPDVEKDECVKPSENEAVETAETSNEAASKDATNSEGVKKIDSMSILKNMSQYVTVKSLTKPKVMDSVNDCTSPAIKEPGTKEDVYESDENDPEKEEQNDSAHSGSPKEIAESKCNPDLTKNKSLEVLKSLGQNITIKSSPRQQTGQTEMKPSDSGNTKSSEDEMDKDEEVPNNDIVKTIKSGPVKSTVSNEQTASPNAKKDANTVVNKDYDKLQNVIKGLSQNITIRSNNSNPNTIVTNHVLESKQAESNKSDMECEDDSLDGDETVKNDVEEEKQISQAIVKKSESSQPDMQVQQNKNIANVLKNLGNNITVKSPSPQAQNSNIKISNSNQSNSTIKAGIDKNNDIIKKVSQNVTIKSLGQPKVINTHEDDEAFDEEWDSEHSDLEESDAAIVKPSQTLQKVISQKTASVNVPVFHNVGHGLTIKQMTPKASTSEANNLPNSIHTQNVSNVKDKKRTISPKDRVITKGICKNTEIFNIDDSDSDDIDKATSLNVSKPRASQGIPTNKPHMLPPNCINLRNITVKPVKTNVEVKEDMDNENDSFESDCEDNFELNQNKSASVDTKTQKMLINNKNITIKSNNSNTTKPVSKVTQMQPAVPVVNKHFSDEEEQHSDLDDMMDDIPLHKIVKNNSSAEVFNKNSLVKSFENFDSDSDDFPDDDIVDEEQETPNDSLINKLKTLNQNLSIKPSSNSNHVPKSEPSGMKRNLTEEADSNSNQHTMAKLCKPNTSKIEDNNMKQLVSNQTRSLNQHSASTNTNSMQQKVTTSVRRIQTETVVEEITTTVTRTIKTINQTSNKQMIESSHQTGRTSQPVRFASPSVVQGGRPNLPRGIQGTKVRMSSVDMRPRMRQSVPVRLNSNTRLPKPPQRMPGPSKPVDKGPVKVAPNVVSQLNRTNQSSSQNEESGHFSCFRKPKESPLHGLGSDVPSSHASMTQESNFSNTKKLIVSDGAGGSQVKLKSVSSAQQHIQKLSNMSGMVVKSSSTQKVSKVEQCEMSSASRNTLDAIQRLQRSGLLVKKPRVQEEVDEMDYNSDEDPGGTLLAIESGS